MSNLWKVSLVGGTWCPFHKEFYVVSDSSDDAYDTVVKDLSKNYIGKSHELVLEKVELIASGNADFKHGTKLYLPVHERRRFTVEEVIEKVKKSIVKRTPEECDALLVKAKILDENGDYHPDFFSEETIQKGREARLARQNKETKEK